jgi:Icc-related predicted phosphoesterase
MASLQSKIKNNKAFLFSDLHDSKKALYSMYELVIHEGCSLILFAGDIVNQGEPISFAEDFLKTIEKIGLSFLWIPGNNDFGRSYELVSARYPTLEGRVVEMLGRKFTGVGGSPESWAGHYAGESPVDSKFVADSIFITHAPPPVAINLEKFDREKDQKTEKSTVKKLSDSPLVHICGHVHDRWGVGYLGETKIVKLAPFFFGHYAIMDLDTLHVEFGKANARPLIG